jgi:formylglycine-generating enzyme required for sulfatase activity
MNKGSSLTGIFLLLSLALAACAPAATPTPTVPPAVDPPATEAPAAEPPSTPSLEPVVFTAPPMEVGSKFFYVDGSILVAVPAGEFLMGHGGQDDPEHTVYLDDFWIYRSPVTNSQYARCVEAGDCAIPDLKLNTAYGDPHRANDPVAGVNYEQGASYCEFVNGRLPTEAEWEKTARGPDGNIYPWGDATPTCDLLNAAQCVNKTTDVTTYPQGQSYYEALDLAGNVFEWVADWYRSTYYGESPAENPLGPDNGNQRSVRSNGFDSEFYLSESARRSSLPPVEKRSDLGFRCVVEDPTYFAPYCELALVYGDPLGGGSPGGGGLASVTCPIINVSQGLNCGPNYTPETYVTFSGNPASTPLDITAPGMPDCQDLGGNQYKCFTYASLTAKADCEVILPGDPSCPPGYSPSGNVCVPDAGNEGRCLAGFNYDPATQCCSALPGAPGPNVPLPLCPAGTYYANPPGICVDVPTAGNVLLPVTVQLKTCGPGDNGGCEEPPAGCPGVTGAPGGGTWDPVNCKCN